jgi:hypothetical protein
MHCPNCGLAVETESTSFCTRCGQQLDRIRTAMSDNVIEIRNIEISHASLNLGVGLMFVGVWPALLAVISSPIAIPAALLMLIAVWFVILLGSGPLLRLFQHSDMPKEIERARRREIAFGSTLMFFGTMIATMLVAVTTPDRWVPMGLVTAITGVFVLLLASSKILFQGYRNLATNEPPELVSAETQALATGSLDDALVQLPPADAREFTNPPSISDNTTRHLVPPPE